MSNNVVRRVYWPLSLRVIGENAVLTRYVSLQKTTSRIQEEFVVVYLILCVTLMLVAFGWRGEGGY